MSSLPVNRLLMAGIDGRERAAESIQRAATERPERLEGSLDRIAEGLGDGSDRVREHVARTLSAVAADGPTAVGPVSEAMVASIGDDSAAVRSELAWALAELAGVRPRRVRFAIDELVPRLSDVKWVRREVARTLAALAVRYPEALDPHVDPLTRALLDEYHPVQTAVLWTMASLELTYDGVLDPVTQRLRELADSEVPAVRQAACFGLAARGDPWTRSLLAERRWDDPDPTVQESARRALETFGDGAASGRPDGTDLVSTFEAVERGAWVAVEVGGHGPSLVGRATAERRAESDSDAEAARKRGLRRDGRDGHEEWLAAPRIVPSGERRVLHLHNPFEDCGVNLVRRSGSIEAVRTGADQPGPETVRLDRLRPVDADRARLLAATPGDTLAFELDGAAHKVEVTAAARDGGTYRVVGENAERGYEITFRPLGDAPLMAVFSKGRAFAAGNVQLR